MLSSFSLACSFGARAARWDFSISLFMSTLPPSFKNAAVKVLASTSFISTAGSIFCCMGDVARCGTMPSRLTRLRIPRTRIGVRADTVDRPIDANVGGIGDRNPTPVKWEGP